MMQYFYSVKLDNLQGYRRYRRKLDQRYSIIYESSPKCYAIAVPEGRETLEREEILAIVEEIKKEVDQYLIEDIDYTDHMLITDAVLLNYYEIPLSTIEERGQQMIFDAAEKFHIPLKDIVLQWE